MNQIGVIFSSLSHQQYVPFGIRRFNTTSKHGVPCNNRNYKNAPCIQWMQRANVPRYHLCFPAPMLAHSISKSRTLISACNGAGRECLPPFPAFLGTPVQKLPSTYLFRKNLAANGFLSLPEVYAYSSFSQPFHFYFTTQCFYHTGSIPICQVDC